MPTAKECELTAMQEIMKNISTSIHDEPPLIIVSFELLLTEEINDDFLRSPKRHGG